MYHVTTNARLDVKSPTVTSDVGCRVSTLDSRHSARCCNLEMETN